MKTGIQYQNKLELQHVAAAQFDFIEYRQEDFLSLPEAKLPVSGLEVKLDGMDAQEFLDALELVQQAGASYLLLQTIGCSSRDSFLEILKAGGGALRGFGGEIYIENGFVGDDRQGYAYGAYSTPEDLREICRYGNRSAGKDIFKAALNIGYANLLEKNLPRMIEELGASLGLIHVSDNDGRSNTRQMPYTFTTGRGVQSTAWNQIVGAMMKISYDGWLIFDTAGLFRRIPADVQLPMLKLLKEIEKRWLWQYRFEDRLSQPGKQIILFGAGKMACNYLRVWGEKYRPVFLVDNNAGLWGTNLDGIAIKSPEAIREVPEKERLVLICNVHYNEIRTQLTNMGIPYEFYNDGYYM